MNTFFTAVLAGQLMCAAPAALNKSEYSWNKRDSYMKVQAQLECQRKFKQSPCLKCIFKTEKQAWLVTCMPKIEAKKQYVNNEVACEHFWRKFEKVRRKKVRRR